MDAEKTTAHEMTAPSGTAEFDTLVAAHVEQYRSPLGALTHPESAQVPSPTTALDPARMAEARRVVNRCADAAIFLGVATLMAVAGVIVAMALVSDDAFVAMVGVLPGAVMITAALAVLTTKSNAAMEVLAGGKVTVAADVAAAYLAYRDAPAAMRAAVAPETAVAAVEERLPYVEDLLLESARLHGLDADASEDALAVRDRLIELASKAQSLVVLAQRHQTAIDDAEASTAFLLGRDPGDAALDETAASLIEETTWVHGVLDTTTGPVGPARDA